MHRIFAITQYIIIAALLSLAVLLAGMFLPASIGYQIRMVTSGSMEPTIHLGSVVLVHPQERYGVGDIITFERSGEEATTHRIVSDEIASGVMQYTVRGDANDANDSRPVKAGEVLGRVWLTVPYLGYILNFLREPIGIAVVLLLPITLYALSTVRKPKPSDLDITT